MRSSEHQAAKAAIGQHVASQLIEDGTSVALDTGTTTVEIARALRGRKITVVTPSLPVINELAGTETAVLVIGGLLRGRELGMVGPVADQTTRQFHCDQAFISGPAIHPDLGLMDTDLDGVAVKRGTAGTGQRGLRGAGPHQAGPDRVHHRVPARRAERPGHRRGS